MGNYRSYPPILSGVNHCKRRGRHPWAATGAYAARQHRWSKGPACDTVFGMFTRLTEIDFPSLASVRRACGFVGCWILVCLLGCSLGCSKTAFNPSEQGVSEPVQAKPSPEEVEGVTAQQVLDKLASVYRSAETYFDNAMYHERIVYRDRGVPMEPPSHAVAVVFERPGKLRIGHDVPAGRGPGLSVVLISDGQRLRLGTSDHATELLDLPAPEAMSYASLTSNTTINEIVFPVPMQYLYPQLDLLLASDEQPSKLLSSGDAALLSSDKLGEADCYRVRIDGAFGFYVLWIDKASSILRRLDIPTDEVRREQDPDNELLRLELWIEFADASFDAPINFKTFQLEPGDGVTLVESFTDSSGTKSTSSNDDTKTNPDN